MARRPYHFDQGTEEVVIRSTLDVKDATSDRAYLRPRSGVSLYGSGHGELSREDLLVTYADLLLALENLLFKLEDLDAPTPFGGGHH